MPPLRCQIQRGFFVSRDCGEIAIGVCNTCLRAMCHTCSAGGSDCINCARHPDDHNHDRGHDDLRTSYHNNHGHAVRRRDRHDDDHRQGDQKPAVDPATAALAAGAMAAGADAAEDSGDGFADGPVEADFDTGSEASVFDS